MRLALLVIIAAPLFAGDLDNFLDIKANYTQRNGACLALRGKVDPDAIAAMKAALDNVQLQACAAANLRSAGASKELLDALTASDATTRAVAAREQHGQTIRHHDRAHPAALAGDGRVRRAGRRGCRCIQVRDLDAMHLVEPRGLRREPQHAGELRAIRGYRFRQRPGSSNSGNANSSCAGLPLGHTHAKP